MKGLTRMAHDSEHFRRRAAQARDASHRDDDGESVEVAGHLALAYAALARRRKAAAAADPAADLDPVVASVADDVPLMLRD